MEKSIFFTLALGFIFSSAHVYAYKAGSSYVYNYETQVVSGLPLTAPVYSIVKLRATVTFQFKTATKVLMKVENVNLYKVNARFETVDPSNEKVPEEFMIPITGEDASMVKQNLSIPVKFRYTKGLVSGILTESEDPLWSVNFKKGCLSMLQVNLVKSKLIESSEAIVADNYAGQIQSEVYTVMETSPAGECACIYTVNEEASLDGEVEMANNFFEVNKVRDFSNCIERPVFVSNTFGAEKCAQCEPMTVDPLGVTSNVRYVLSGTREQFFIQSAIGESRYIFSATSRNTGYAATIINQTMEFVSCDPLSAPFPEPRIPKEWLEGVKVLFPEHTEVYRSLIVDSALAMAPAQLSQTTVERFRYNSDEFITKVVSALRAVAIDFKEGVTEEGPYISTLAVDLLRKATTEELRTIYKTYAINQKTGGPIAEEMRKTMWHTLPQAGTIAAITVLCEAIEAGDIPVWLVNYNTFQNVALYAEPYPEIFERILSLAKSGTLTTRQARRSIWLCVGVLMDRMNSLYNDKEETLREQLEKTQAILSVEGRGKARQQLQMFADEKRMLMEAIRSSKEQAKRLGIEALADLLKSTNVEEKVVALKAIGNAGAVELMASVIQIINDNSNPMTVKQQAVYSLRKMTKREPKVILNTLLPVYTNVAENELVRLAAFTTIVKCEPPLAYLQIIARSLNVETNPQVGSYVYSYLSELSNSTHPCYLNLATNCTLALKLVKTTPTESGSSFMKHYSATNEYAEMSQAIEASVFGSRDSILPRGVSVSYIYHLFGYSVHLGEVIVETRGAQTILDRLFGPSGVLTEGQSISDILKPKRSRQRARDVIEKIARKIKLVEREMEETQISVCFKYLNSELNYISLDLSFIKDLIANGLVFPSSSEDSLGSAYNINLMAPQSWGGIRKVLPTEAGLPMRMHGHYVVMATFTGTLAAGVMPSSSEERRNPTAFKGSVNIRPSFARDAFGQMAVDTAFYRSAVKISNRVYVNNINIAGTFEADITKGKFFTSIETPQQEKKIAGFNIRPFTFYENINDESTKETMDVVCSEKGVVYPVNIELFRGTHVGTTVGLRGLLTTDEKSKGQISWPMSGKQTLIVFTRPENNGAQKVDINMQFVSSDEYNFERESEESEGEDSVVSRLLNTMWWGESSKEGASWEEDFDLREKDLSVVGVAEETKAPVIENGRKHAFALCIEGVGTSPLRSYRLQGLIQRSPADRRMIFNAKITSTCSGYKKRAYVDMAMNFHRNETTVSELTNPEHQHLVRQHIRVASLTDPLSEVALIRSSQWWVTDWQKTVTKIRNNAPASYPVATDPESSAFGPTERTLYEAIEQIIVKQELIARRVADPVLQTMNNEEEEMIADRISQILEESKDTQAQAERLIMRIKQFMTRKGTQRSYFIISLKIHQAIVHHRDLLERVEAIINSCPVQQSRRLRLAAMLNNQLTGVERLLQIHQAIVNDINPEGDSLSASFETSPMAGPQLSRVTELTSRQVQIAVEIEKIRKALGAGASAYSVIPQTKQIVEHCHEIVESASGVTEELCSENHGEYIPSLQPYLRVFQIVIRQDQLFQQVKQIGLLIKFAPDTPAEDAVAIGVRCMEHNFKLQALLGSFMRVYQEIMQMTAQKTARSESIPELPVYMTAYANITLTSEKSRPWSIQFITRGDKSLEQLIYEMRQGNPETRDPVITQILNDESSVSEKTLRQVRWELNTLRKFKVEAAWSAPVGPTRAAEWIMTYLKLKNYIQLSYGVVNVTTPPGQGRLDVQFTRDGREVSYAVMTPSGTTKFWDVGLSRLCPAGVSILGRESDIFTASPAICSCKFDSMETFDGKIYRLPETEECEKVLTMDCSSQKTFAIMLTPRRSEKVVRVVIENQDVEVTLRRVGEYLLKVNGAVNQLTREPLIIRGEGYNDRGPVVLRIFRNGPDLKIEAERRGVAVRLSQKIVEIRASPFYRSKLCGLCGNNDGQLTSEFEDAEMRVHAQPESFGVSYLVPHKTCKREELFKKYPEDIISQPAGCMPILRNMVRKSTERSGEVCFSTSPVRLCPSGCQAQGTLPKIVGFHCLPATDPSVQAIVEVSKNRVLREMLSRNNDIQEEVLEHRQCVRP